MDQVIIRHPLDDILVAFKLWQLQRKFYKYACAGSGVDLLTFFNVLFENSHRFPGSCRENAETSQAPSTQSPPVVVSYPWTVQFQKQEMTWIQPVGLLLCCFIVCADVCNLARALQNMGYFIYISTKVSVVLPGWVGSSTKIWSVLLPCTCGCGLIWKQGLCRCNQDEIRSCWIILSPKPSNWCPYKKRHRQSQGRDLTKMETGTIKMHLKAKGHQWWPETTKTWKRQGRSPVSPLQSSKGAWLCQYHDFKLQKVGNKFHCFNSPVL